MSSALVAEHTTVCANRLHPAANQRRTAAAQIDELLIQMQNGGFLLLERRHIDFFMIGAERKPRPAHREPSRGGTVPRHRSPFRVASQAKSRLVFLCWVLQLIRRNGHVCHAYL